MASLPFLPSKISLLLLLAAGCLLCIYDILLHSRDRLRPEESGRLTNTLLTKLAGVDRDFFPVNNPEFHYVGRWVAASSSSQWHTAFPGSYVDFTVSNTSSFLVSLDNPPSSFESRSRQNEHVSVARALSLSQHVRGFHPGAVSIMAHVDRNKTWYFERNRMALLNVPIDNLDSHNVRLTYVGSSSTSKQSRSTMRFKGIWLDKGGKLVDVVRDFEHSNTFLTHPSTLAIEQPARVRNPVQALMQNTSNLLEPFGAWQRSFELISDETNLLQTEQAASMFSIAAGPISRLVSWEFQLAAIFHADHFRMFVEQACLLSKKCAALDEATFTAQDIYFRSGLPGSSFFSRPWRFTSPPPDILILNLGSNDAAALACILSDAEAKSSQSVTKFLQSFTHAYETLVKSIRKAAHTTQTPQHTKMRYDYLYNSAPNLMPIILLPPVNAPAIITQALRAVVTSLRKEGDTSLSLLDTRGWLGPGHLVHGQRNITIDQKSCTVETVALALHAHKRYAAYLSQHLCPYLARDPSSCPFRPAELYEGKVFNAVEDELNKVLLESKINKVKEGLFGMALAH